MSITVTTSSRAVLVRIKRGKRTPMKSAALRKLGSDLTLRR